MQRDGGYRLILASAKDVRAARDRTAIAINRVNDRLRPQGTTFDLWRWETHAVAGLRPDGPDGIINRELDAADVVILIAWNRIGPGATKALEAALARWTAHHKPTLLAFFSEEPSVLTTEEACLERIEVLNTRALLEKVGDIHTYTDLNELTDKMELELLALARRQRRASRPQGSDAGLLWLDGGPSTRNGLAAAATNGVSSRSRGGVGDVAGNGASAPARDGASSRSRGDVGHVAGASSRSRGGVGDVASNGASAPARDGASSRSRGDVGDVAGASSRSRGDVGDVAGASSRSRVGVGDVAGNGVVADRSGSPPSPPDDEDAVQRLMQLSRQMLSNGPER